MNKVQLNERINQAMNEKRDAERIKIGVICSRKITRLEEQIVEYRKIIDQLSSASGTRLSQLSSVIF